MTGYQAPFMRADKTFNEDLNDRVGFQTTNQFPQMRPNVRAPQSNAAQRELNVAKRPIIETNVKTPEEFVYQYDFDDNGALYFLGSYGKTRIWQNPHAIG